MDKKEYICYKNLKLENSSKYNFKSLILPKLELNENYQIKTLNDISELQIKFAKTFPYNNNDIINGKYSYDLDYIVNTTIVLGNGGVCLSQNILFGMLLEEFGIDTQLIKCFDLQHPSFSLAIHYTNIIKFNGNLYLVESCYTMQSSFYPVEINGCNNDNITKSHRIIKSSEIKDEEIYMQQSKEIGTNIWNPLFSFSLNIVTHEYIKNSIDKAKEYVIINRRNIFNMVTLYLKFDDGYYFYSRGTLQICNNENPKKIIVINNATQLSKIVSKYFKIKNYDVEFLK